MTTAVIYSNGNQECERIAQLLKALPQVSEFLRYDLDKDFSKTQFEICLLYTSPSPRDTVTSRMPSSA